MHIKIYFGNKPVFLCDELNEELKELLHHPDAVFIDEVTSPAIKSLLHEIKKEEFLLAYMGVVPKMLKGIEKPEEFTSLG